jgi:hypothetical protein
MNFVSKFLPVSLMVVFALTSRTWSEEPCVSGVAVGKRPGPYSFLVATGPQRGQSTCYICETEDRPAVVVFARSPNESLGKLVKALDGAVSNNKAADMCGWVTFLSKGDDGFEERIVKWGRDQAIRTMPLGLFENKDGPPSYKIANEAEVTVLLFTKQKVVTNFAFRAGELRDERIKEVLAAIPGLLGKK